MGGGAQAQADLQRGSQVARCRGWAVAVGAREGVPRPRLPSEGKLCRPVQGPGRAGEWKGEGPPAQTGLRGEARSPGERLDHGGASPGPG